MVEYFRGKRDEFLVSEAQGKAPRAAGAAKAKVEPKAKLTLDALKGLKFGEITL